MFHFNKAHLTDQTIPMWVLKFHGETYYVNHVECNVPWSTKETPDNPHTKGSIKVKDVLVTIDDDNNANLKQLTVFDKIRLRNQKLGITRIIFKPHSEMHKAWDIAMTGEVTLRGNALAIGGLKEKLLAALRGGIKTVLIPEENAKDLAEIPDNVKEGLRIVPVAHVREVLREALVRMPDPVEWDEAAEEAAAAARRLERDNTPTATAH